MIIVRLFPQGGNCANTHTEIPDLVVYRNGEVLMSSDGGYYCEPVPQITMGHVDPALAAAALDRYFELPAAAVEMTTLDGNTGVADGSTTDLTYVDTNGIRHHSAAYVLDMDGLGLSAEKTAARAAFAAILGTVRAMIVKGARWTPGSIRIVNPPRFVVGYDSKLDWPGHPSKGVKSVLTGYEGSCTILSGPEATAVLRILGSTPAMSSWSIDGRKERIAIGIVIPGLEDCPAP